MKTTHKQSDDNSLIGFFDFSSDEEPNYISFKIVKERRNESKKTNNINKQEKLLEIKKCYRPK